MQEIKKRRIVIASVLKPVDDSRMSEKIAVTLAAQHDVHVIGFSGTTVQPSNVVLHPMGKFSRISLKRMVTPWRILRMLFDLKPEILIVCTHELLVQAWVMRVFTRCRVWYDVQENYSANILHTKTFPLVLRPLLAGYIRLKEHIATLFVETFLLAEASYLQEMPYLKESVVLENKVRRERTESVREKQAKDRASTRLLFTGTLSESTGIYTAIDIASRLHEVDPEIRLTIVGFCPRTSDFERLRAICEHAPFITLKGGDRLIPHSDILDEIMQADFGLITYPRNPSTWGSVPTKLYEYMGMKLPIMMVANPKWTALTDRYTASIVVDPDHFSAASVIASMRIGVFYRIDPQDVYWESEEDKLLDLV
jgi:glycosyltransferase involved in cell wall biosynthesis